MPSLSRQNQSAIPEQSLQVHCLLVDSSSSAVVLPTILSRAAYNIHQKSPHAARNHRILFSWLQPAAITSTQPGYLQGLYQIDDRYGYAHYFARQPTLAIHLPAAKPGNSDYVLAANAKY